MAKKDKTKIVRKLKGKSAEKKKAAIRKMVEALISNDSEAASKHLHDYLSMKSRNILGEEADESSENEKDEESDANESDDDEDEKEKEDEDDDDEDDDEDDEKEDMKESVKILSGLNESLLDEIYSIILEKKPSSGMSKSAKSKLVAKAKKGEDIGKSGKKFKEIEKKAAKEYGSEEAGKRVAAAAMWKSAKR